MKPQGTYARALLHEGNRRLQKEATSEASRYLRSRPRRPQERKRVKPQDAYARALLRKGNITPQEEETSQASRYLRRRFTT